MGQCSCFVELFKARMDKATEQPGIVEGWKKVNYHVKFNRSMIEFCLGKGGQFLICIHLYFDGILGCAAAMQSQGFCSTPAWVLLLERVKAFAGLCCWKTHCVR